MVVIGPDRAHTRKRTLTGATTAGQLVAPRPPATGNRMALPGLAGS